MIIKSLIKYVRPCFLAFFAYVSSFGSVVAKERPIELAAINVKRKAKVNLQRLNQQLQTLRDLKRYYNTKRARLQEKAEQFANKGLKMDLDRNRRLLEDYDSIIGIIQREIFQLEIQIESLRRFD